MSIKVNNKKIATTISSQFDAAVVDLVTGLDKQKQVLAQALNDKGVNVTSADTLDKMAAEIKELDVVGGQDKVVCEFYNLLNTTSSTLAQRIGSAQARVLREHNAIISRTSAGVFSIFKLASEGDLIQIATYDCNDFVPSPSTNQYCRFGTSKNEEHIAWYDGKLQKLIAFHMDWETNTLTRTLTYTVTTANVGTDGNYSAPDGNKTKCLLGVAPASDGSKVCIFTNGTGYRYIYTTVVDVATQTEVTNLGIKANGVNTEDKICFGFWHWDIETGIIKGGTSYFPLFEMTLDLSGDIPFLSFNGYRITNVGTYGENYYGMPYFLWEKGIMLQLAANGNKTGKYGNASGVYGTLWLRDIETGEVLDSVEVEVDRYLVTDKSYEYTGAYVGVQSSYGSSYTPVVVKKNGKILVGFGMYMRFELDEENKKLIPYKHNGAKDSNSRYVCFPVQGYTSEYYNMTIPPNYIYCDENPDLIFAPYSYNENYGEWVYSNKTILYTREEPCVLGLFFSRNGKRRLMYDYFSYTQYQAGAYAEKDEVAVVNVES